MPAIDVYNVRNLVAGYVQNDVDDVDDTTYNNLVDDTITVTDRIRNNNGGKENGLLVIGSLTNPPASAPSVQLFGSGSITGTNLQYAIAFFNLSGVTTLTNASGTISPSNQKVKLTGLPVSGQTTLCTGRKVYRSDDGGTTWKLVATIWDNSATEYIDNVTTPSTTENHPGSNTTSATVGTIDPGSYYGSSLVVSSGQTLTLNAVDNNLDGWLGLFIQGNVTIDGTINGDGKGPDRGLSTSQAQSPISANVTGDGLTSDTVNPSAGKGRGRHWRVLDVYQGLGGGSLPIGDGVAGTPGKPGATIFIKASGAITLGSASTITTKGANAVPGSVTSNGSSPGSGGGAGGCVYLISDTSINFPAGAVLNVSGGVGGNAFGIGSSGTVRGGGGGGGGLTMLTAPTVTNSGTHTVSGGAGGANATLASNFSAGGGGANVGGGGETGSGTGSAGGTVVIQTHPQRLNFAGLP